MRNTAIFLYEGKHFIRSPFKVAALLLFIITGIYGLHNGADLYNKQTKEIAHINKKAQEQKRETTAYFDRGEKGPSDTPWIDLTTPFCAVRNTAVYHFKAPSSSIVFSIGQTEQYGFYKKITTWSSPYDTDMTEEIANPERLQLGTLDFSFVILFLMPLLLLILVYNIKGTEVDAGFLPMVYTQAGNTTSWLLIRITFYASLLIITLLALMFYGASLTNVFNEAFYSFWNIFALFLIYLLFWTAIYTLVLRKDHGSISNTLKMVGMWLVFTFIIPASVHQWVSINHPANLMTDLIDAQRDETNKLFDEPLDDLQSQLIQLFPEISNSQKYKDTTNNNRIISRSVVGLANQLVKNSLKTIEDENLEKNNIISNTYWFNPLSFFQNKLNLLTNTHYHNYQNYRNEVQLMIDKQIKLMVLDSWNDIKVNKATYLNYYKKLKQ